MGNPMEEKLHYKGWGGGRGGGHGKILGSPTPLNENISSKILILKS